MKTFALILVPLLGVAAAAPADIDALIDAARAAPGEFAADAMIRIAGTDTIEKARKIELLEQAFQRASGAQQPFRRHAVPLRLDGSSTYWNRVYNQDLDALSLRLRAIEAMLPLDGRKAADLFAQIPPLRFPQLKCEDFLVYDPGRFYDVLGSIANQDPEPAKLLRKYAGAAASPVQLAPMARVLAAAHGAAHIEDSDFQALAASFASAMGKVSGDDRSFTFATSLGKEIQALAEECKRRHVTPLPLIEGYRLYLVVNFSGSRCADDDQLQTGQQSFGIYTGQPAEMVAANFIAFFNEKLRMPPLAPIQEQEATPARLEGVAAGLHFCEDEPCKKFVEQFHELVFGASGTPLPPAERNTPEWQGKLKARLTALSEWKDPGSAGAAEYYREKSGAFSELLNLAQNGPNRELVLRAWLDFVKQNPFQKVNRIEWFLPVNALIGRVGLDPGGLGKFAEELRKVNDPLIALYADLEAVAPRTPDRILPLL
ncbi:conserved exported hypothetical protein [Candidatus Sulfopaludibacter sp. SbA4]|nr:conserved exported hypothetical protein [Candidatus Sulfopaludibacter sp. SbA4]